MSSTDTRDLVNELFDGARRDHAFNPTDAQRDIRWLAAVRIQELEAALRIVALQAHDVTLTEPVDWREVANTFVGVARGVLEKGHQDV